MQNTAVNALMYSFQNTSANFGSFQLKLVENSHITELIYPASREVQLLPSEMTPFHSVSSNFEGARDVVDNEVGDHVTSVAKRRNHQSPFEPQSPDYYRRKEEAGEHKRSLRGIGRQR